MATPRPCADGPCCSQPSAVLGVQQTLEEMDFERGEAAARPKEEARGRGEAGELGPESLGPGAGGRAGLVVPAY